MGDVRPYDNLWVICIQGIWYSLVVGKSARSTRFDDPAIDAAAMRRLYAEFAEEDRALANMGLWEWVCD